jgi:hypothetical protein
MQTLLCGKRGVSYFAADGECIYHWALKVKLDARGLGVLARTGIM